MVHGSSIYVGRHKADTYSEGGPPESTNSEECEDFLEEDFCVSFKSYCSEDEEGKAGKLFQGACRKTCGKCRQAPSRSDEDNNWMFLYS